MEYELVQTSQALQDYCETIASSSVICVDTEFMRVKTYYPQLALVQIYDGAQLALIDTTQIDDLGPLCALLTNPHVLKVLHSCSEDLEAFYSQLNIAPSPVFDTQVAAGLAGLGVSLGYGRLVADLLGIEVDKSEARTDWLFRPLSSEQCKYAAYDVFYLWKVYEIVEQKLKTMNRFDWVIQEAELTLSKKMALLPAEFSYLTLKNNWKFSGLKLTLLKELAQWRTTVARKNDIALNFVVKEAFLPQLVHEQPKSKQALFTIKGLPMPTIRRYGDKIIEIITTVLVESKPRVDKVQRLIDFPGYKAISKQINTMCEEVAEKEGIPLTMLASKKMISQLLKWMWFKHDETALCQLKPDLCCQWRYQLLGEQLEKLLGQPLTRDE